MLVGFKKLQEHIVTGTREALQVNYLQRNRYSV